jgi:hypothetical protein
MDTLHDDLREELIRSAYVIDYLGYVGFHGYLGYYGFVENPHPSTQPRGMILRRPSRQRQAPRPSELSGAGDICIVTGPR